MFNLLKEITLKPNPELQNVTEKTLSLLAVSAPEEVANGLDCEGKEIRVLLCRNLLSINNLPQNIKKLASNIHDLDVGPDEKRFDALNILGELKDRRALPAIAELQTCEAIPIKISALKTLGLIGDARALNYQRWLENNSDKTVTNAFIEMMNELPGEAAILMGIPFFKGLAKYCADDESLFSALDKWLNRFEQYCEKLDTLGKEFLLKIEFARKAFEASRVILRANKSSDADENKRKEHIRFLQLLLLGLGSDPKHQDVLNMADPLHPARKMLEQIGALCVIRFHFENSNDKRPLKGINKKASDLLEEALKICPEDYALQGMKRLFPSR
jgi:hypothetical protein